MRFRDRAKNHPQNEISSPSPAASTSRSRAVPNGCGQHDIAGIGFQGGKLAGRPAPQYLVHVGGGIRADGADFGRLVGKVPAAAPPPPSSACSTSTSARAAPATRSGHRSLADLADADAVESDFVDLGEASAFEVVAGEGECAS